ncbi:MAG: phosphatidylserine decarboxylase [Burkholderiaceae bacterium]|jgi:phosphatidylserine decarboxylase
MNAYPHPIIAREGWPHLAIVGAAALLLTLFAPAWAAVLGWIVLAFVLQFFRDPPRVVPQADEAILSPADGRVVAIEKTRDVYADRDALKISVFMNVFNVHSNRAPIDGTIMSVSYFPGKFVNADLDKASLENERNAVVARRADGQVVTFVQVAGLIARRILCYVAPGESLKRGQRYGFIRFGSRVDVYLPTTAVPKIAIGDVVQASSTVLANLPGLVAIAVEPV